MLGADNGANPPGFVVVEAELGARRFSGSNAADREAPSTWPIAGAVPNGRSWFGELASSRSTSDGGPSPPREVFAAGATP